MQPFQTAPLDSKEASKADDNVIAQDQEMADEFIYE